MGPTSPLSVGGGVFELGCSFRSGLFSCPGLLEEWSPSAWRVPSRVCAWTVSPANVAAANAAEPNPRTLLLETPSCIILSFFSSLIALVPYPWRSSTTFVLVPQEQQKQINLTCVTDRASHRGCDARLISSSANKTRQVFRIAAEGPTSPVSGNPSVCKTQSPST